MCTSLIRAKNAPARNPIHRSRFWINRTSRNTPFARERLCIGRVTTMAIKKNYKPPIATTESDRRPVIPLFCSTPYELTANQRADLERQVLYLTVAAMLARRDIYKWDVVYFTGSIATVLEDDLRQYLNQHFRFKDFVYGCNTIDGPTGVETVPCPDWLPARILADTATGILLSAWGNVIQQETENA
jgi:hypothetical protein